MTSKSGKAKGRRLQVLVADTLSARFTLTIEAAAPTKPGLRANGARYVAEGDMPDLRVRQMGQPGADVALLSEHARAVIRLPGREPIWWECKNSESWALDAGFWRAHDIPKFALKAIQQAYGACLKEGSLDQYTAMPVIVLGKNNHEPLALWQSSRDERSLFGDHGAITLSGPAWTICRLDKFVEVLWKQSWEEPV